MVSGHVRYSYSAGGLTLLHQVGPDRKPRSSTESLLVANRIRFSIILK